MSLTLIKNANVFAPRSLGIKDILLGAGKILAIEDEISPQPFYSQTWDAQGKTVTPGFIDQHIHVLGAGGKRGFSSITPPIQMSELIASGTTTVVGLLGTDGYTKSIKNLYAKVKALEEEGISAYMYTGYYGIDPVFLHGNLQDDLVFNEKVLGCKLAIADIRSSFPTDEEMIRILRNVRVGAMVGGKKGILHLHLGSHESGMDILFRMVKDFEFPIQHISPTHVGRTAELFDQAMDFARLGGMIDITTGASKFTEPYLAVLMALEKGIPMDKMTFSSDGYAGLDELDENGKLIGLRKAAIDENYGQVRELVREGSTGIEEAICLITSNPAANLGLKNKGRIEVGADADLCALDEDFRLQDVFAMGRRMMQDGNILVKGHFES